MSQPARLKRVIGQQAHLRYTVTDVHGYHVLSLSNPQPVRIPLSSNSALGLLARLDLLGAGNSFRLSQDQEHVLTIGQRTTASSRRTDLELMDANR
ncbi:hypothetical protein VTK56DRAFT_4179 [Thermocarpiscus australiensis]